MVEQFKSDGFDDDTATQSNNAQIQFNEKPYKFAHTLGTFKCLIFLLDQENFSESFPTKWASVIF
jgi:hypothetical protein